MSALATAPPPTSALDESLITLPFFEPRHAERARSLEAWALGHNSLFTLDESPEQVHRRILAALGEDGWLSFLTRPGDPDGDLRSICLARETLAYTADLADFAFSIQTLAATALLRHGSVQQQATWLPGLARGTTVAAFALSELEAGSDVAKVGLQAEAEGQEWVLTGSKAWIAAGTVADLIVVVARTGPGSGPLGLSAFLVPGDCAGLGIEPVDLLAPRALAGLSFDGVRLPSQALLGRRGQGFVIAMDVLERYRATVGAAALGFARRASDAALHRTRSRRSAGGVLADLQLVKAALADIDVRLNAAGLLVARAAWEIDHQRGRAGRHSAIAKLYVTEAAQEVVDSAVQLFGAAGLVSGSLPESLYRQVRLMRIYEGATDILKLIVADSLDTRRPDRPLA